MPIENALGNSWVIYELRHEHYIKQATPQTDNILTVIEDIKVAKFAENSSSTSVSPPTQTLIFLKFS
jgi:hypothetical protein